MTNAADAPSEITVAGEVRSIIFRDPGSGFTVAAVVCDEGEIRVTGYLATVRPGANYIFYGDWISHPKYGRQFSAGALEEIVPTEEEGIVGYLASGLIPGVGEKLAQRLVDHFGLETLEIIGQQPARLTEVPGIGEKLSRKITRAVSENKDVERLMVFLRHHRVSTGLALKIHGR